MHVKYGRIFNGSVYADKIRSYFILMQCHLRKYGRIFNVLSRVTKNTSVFLLFVIDLKNTQLTEGPIAL